jgi:hypothetical protein
MRGIKKMLKGYKFPRNHLCNPIDDLYDKLERGGIDLLDIIRKINLNRKPKIVKKIEKFSEKKEITYLELTNEKMCSRCKEWKKWTVENFHKEGNKKNLKSICKLCVNKYDKIRRDYLKKVKDKENERKRDHRHDTKSF